MHLKKIYTPLPLAGSEEELEENLAHVERFGPRGGMVFWEEGQPFVKIPLTKGMFTIIDLEDYDNIGRFRWYAALVVKTVYAFRRHDVDGVKKIVGRPQSLAATPNIRRGPQGP